MSDKLIEGLVSIAVAIVGLALVAVLFGSRQTSGVISSAGTAFGKIIGAAVAPVSGGSNFTSGLGSLGGSF
jgi:PRD1 phage membrane DNA delivery